MFRIARRVAKDRVISTVDPEARHGHKTAARGFDGYKGHVAIDPDSEMITATTVTAGNVGDAAAGRGPARRRLPAEPGEPAAEPAADPDRRRRAPIPSRPAEPDRRAGRRSRAGGRPRAGADAERRARAAARASGWSSTGTPPTAPARCWTRWSAPTREIMCKVQPPVAPAGRFAKDAFAIDLEAGTVTCPAGQVAALRALGRRADRPLRRPCAGLPAGRALHRLARRAHDPRRPARGPAGARPRTPGRPGLEGRLHAPPAPRSNARSAT